MLDQSLYDIVLVDGDQLGSATAAVGSSGTPMVAIGEVADVLTEACVGVLPPGLDDPSMSLLVNLVIERSFLQQRCQELEQLVSNVRDGSAFVGKSPVIRRLNGTLSRAADGDATVLIEGASGTGKSLAARMIHCKSRRGNQPIEVRPAAALDGVSLQQAIEKAHGTTLLIDDVEELSQPAQQVLVRFLKGRPQTSVDSGPRIIATTNARLPEMVARGAFREDLYYRLHAYPVVVPALRERTEDLPELANVLLDQCAVQAHHKPHGLTDSAIKLLQSMSWSGNMTQLQNSLYRAYLAAGGELVDAHHLQAPASSVSEPSQRVGDTVGDTAPEDLGELTEDSIRPFEEEEQRLLSRALRANVRRAAQLLGIGRATLYRKIQQYRLRLQ